MGKSSNNVQFSVYVFVYQRVIDYECSRVARAQDPYSLGPLQTMQVCDVTETDVRNNVCMFGITR